MVTTILVLEIKLFLSLQFLKLILPSWLLMIWFLKPRWFLSWWFLKSSLTQRHFWSYKAKICIYFHYHYPSEVLTTENHTSNFQNFRDLLCFVSFILTLADWRKFGFGFSIREELRFKKTLNVQVEEYQGERGLTFLIVKKT